MSGMFTLRQALPWVTGARLVGDGAAAVTRVHSDTRTLQPGDLFVALRGERFDANDLVGQARAQGAVAALAHRGRIPAGFCGLEVDDSKLALGQLAAGWRAQFRLPLVAVTGSNGKTTVTQMVAAILRAWQGEAALATQGNFNNDIGLPLTLLRLRAQHRVAVLELGMNHPGEIAYLAGIARPTVALVNNAQREHQEFMATVEAVARENGSVFDSLAIGGTAVFPAGDEFSALWRELAGSRACMTFSSSGSAGSARGADIVLAGSEWQEGHWQVRADTPAGPVEFRLHIAGRHNVGNALAAVACTLAAGAPPAAIARGLEAFEPVKGRSRALAVPLAGRVLTLVDDTYNANPDSVRAAIDVLAELPGPRLLVLGDMGEVGEQGPQFPRRGRRVRARARHRRPAHAGRAGARHGRAALRCHRAAAGRGGRAAGRGAQRSGQGLALHEDGAGGGGHHRTRAATTTARQQEGRGETRCCLAWPCGCRPCRLNSASCGCSST
ncbi:Candidate UDP-N-acetylmuramoylalanyl-D-glutamyl-2, 6-diaminopimelate--D-alanyl-D-alanyl ligase [Ramlibacter tataouinensis TTB310]|uniref:UDP-N-acetylmuramoyl-tripeptide--D-alanyl-D-alanine ligase n=1 Tax=Ramlibacter tataouinensis (strain ATCC BAA-407 / DSM 14655 / LMG 21543 / TTB310) TaxID=365046 RepID=F5XZM1_RAMTT|nr:Candidate UDP-N-acetylmuramoylalanyl-D-glutamyl-2, 6-diaminopimelate--D-alanyl-D-alanyl ligase [Ramlibacter tataouinensis TTB310]